MRWAIGADAPRRLLRVTEQSFPGEPEPEEDEGAERVIPDAWIYTDNGWALLIESKLQATLRNDQLKRHVETAKRRGFRNPHVLALTAKRESLINVPGVVTRRWDELYSWSKARAARL